ncbi:MAG: hypothetical protein HFJ29_04495 [Clostridia bacterium]|nr:hypothetical protein [Clostridia bacterium]
MQNIIDEIFENEVLSNIFLVCFLLSVVAVAVIPSYILIKNYKKDKKEMDRENAKNEYFDKILELQKLKEENVLTEAEFEREKAKIKPT